MQIFNRNEIYTGLPLEQALFNKKIFMNIGTAVQKLCVYTH